MEYVFPSIPTQAEAAYSPSVAATPAGADSVGTRTNQAISNIILWSWAHAPAEYNGAAQSRGQIYGLFTCNLTSNGIECLARGW